MIVRVAAGASVPRAQGKAVVQSPVFETKVRPGGVGSVTTTFVAVDGPWLVTWIVKVRFVPAVTPAGPLFNTARSACTAIAVVSVALLLAAVGSVVPVGAATVAVLLSVPLAVDATVPVALNVTDAPAARSTVVAIGPLPEAAPQLAPAPLGVHVHVTPPSAAGNVSATAAPVTGLGPALLTVIV